MKLQQFNQIGKRGNNEDFLGHNEKCVLVCDGVGGHVSGEIASRFIVDYILNATKESEDAFSKTMLQEKITEAQQKMNETLIEHPEWVKMGTTFTGLFFSKEAVFAAHIGDSRIYLIRPSEKKIWHTWDHSLVGELMKHNEITRETGRHHPMGNRISKAIIANEKGKTAKADIVKLDLLKPGDIFLLCSDGVNEAWPEHELMDLLCDTSLSLEEKKQQISLKCNELSKDNNTAYLIEFEADDEISVGNNDDIQWLSLDEFHEDYQAYLKKKKEEEEDDEEVFGSEVVPDAELITKENTEQQTNETLNVESGERSTARHKDLYWWIRNKLGI